MGHPVHGREFWLACRHGHRRVDRGLLHPVPRELGSLADPIAGSRGGAPDDDAARSGLLPVPPWVVAVHLAFMAWTVFNAHDPALFLGGFLFFLGFARATAPYQSRIELKNSAARGLLPRGTRDSRRAPGVVDCARAQ